MKAGPAWILFIIIFIAGCAPDWRRPGTAVEQADRDYTACLNAARAELPPKVVRRQTQPERVVTTRNCRTEAGRQVCTETSRHESARFEDTDLNWNARMARANACMRAQGYELGGIGMRLGLPTDVRWR